MQGDAEIAAQYIVSRVSAEAGSRCFQGAWNPALARGSLGPALDLVATRRLRGVSQPVANALIGWAEGERRVRLLFHVPRPADVLAWQAHGERCVSLLPEGACTAPQDGGLAFVMHDLCHLEKFNEPSHHAGQVGFFASVHAAMSGCAWASFVARFDGELVTELEHVVADMNGSAVFLFAALKMKLKMAVRRKVARERGREARTSGPLDEDEHAAFASELLTLLALLEMDSRSHDAAVLVSTRRDDPEAAHAVLAHFEALGAGRLATLAAFAR